VRPEPLRWNRRASGLLRVVLAVVAAAALATGYALWPVCVALSAEDVAAFQPPIAERDDRMLFGRIFQQRSGQWYQCKTRIARAFFF
jgi:hypothetical protein